MKDKTIIRVDGRIVSDRSAKGEYRTVASPQGRKRIRVIRAEKDDFTSQFASTFRNNVKRAREENRSLAD